MIVDTGLHYKGMKRDQAIKMFAEYAWDESDFTEKEVYSITMKFGKNPQFIVLGQNLYCIVLR